MRRGLWLSIGLAASMGIAFLVGVCFAPRAASQPPGPKPAAAAPARAATVIDTAALDDHIQQVIRSELAAAKAPGAGGPPAGKNETWTEKRVDDPVSGSLVAAEQGRQIVDTALSSHRWTADDAARFHELRRQMNADQQRELLHLLIPAINRQEVKVDFHKRPYF